MIDTINILLLIIIGYVIYKINTKSANDNNKKLKDNNIKNNNKNNNNFGNNYKKHQSHHYQKNNRYIKKSKSQKPAKGFFSQIDNEKYDDDVLDDLVTWDDNYSTGVITKESINPNFINNQFHNDYRDIITAINNIIPDKKQLFNLANRPLNKYSEPEVDEVRHMVRDFITVLNDNLKIQVPNHRNPNSGWDEAIVDPHTESGWDKVQKSLGLPTSLYEKPAPKSPVKLISIKYVQKYETDDEIKYSVDIILQKLNVDDQMIIKADFVQDKRPLNDENNFFKSSMIPMKLAIENIFITGYLSKDGNDAIQEFDGDDVKWYDYNKLEHNNLVDPKYIQRVLMEKYKHRNEEMQGRVSMLDEEGQEFYKTLPHEYDYENIKMTQTIFDDFNNKRTFS